METGMKQIKDQDGIGMLKTEDKNDVTWSVDVWPTN